MGPFFWGLRRLGVLRIGPAEELAGMDETHHGGSAYEKLAGSDAELRSRLDLLSARLDRVDGGAGGAGAGAPSGAGVLGALAGALGGRPGKR